MWYETRNYGDPKSHLRRGNYRAPSYRRLLDQVLKELGVEESVEHSERSEIFWDAKDCVD